MNPTCKECSTALTARQISRGHVFCGCHCSGVARMRSRGARGLLQREFSSDLVLKGINLINSGMRWRDAARVVKMSFHSLRKRAKQMGISVRIGHVKTIAPMTLNIPTRESELGYLAAIIDGEGTISLHRGKRDQVFVTVANTDLALIDWLDAIGGRVRRLKPVRLTNNLGFRKPAYVWAIVARLEVEALLRAVEPFMIIKRQKAQDALARLASFKQEYSIVDDRIRKAA
jgi:hypothetical protein